MNFDALLKVDSETLKRFIELAPECPEKAFAIAHLPSRIKWEQEQLEEKQKRKDKLQEGSFLKKKRV